MTLAHALHALGAPAKIWESHYITGNDNNNGNASEE
jgi:hypothetical protein